MALPGMLPWNSNFNKIKYPDAEYFTRPLGPAPSGKKWEQVAEHQWTLRVVETDEKEGAVAPIRVVESQVVEHLITPDDTLQGICLKYHVSATELRRVNFFSGNNIKTHKILKIPLVAGVTYIPPTIEDHDAKINRFISESQEARAEAKVYLEAHDWNLDKAIQAWKDDSAWLSEEEQRNNLQLRSAMLPEMEPLELER